MDVTGFICAVDAANALDHPIVTIKQSLSGARKCVKSERVRGAKSHRVVIRRPGVGPQDAVQHAGAEPSV